MGDVTEYVVIRGRRYCACSVAVLEMAEAGFKAAGIIPKTASIHDYVTQGGYRAGATAASKGSHDRGGVHDTWFSLVNTDAKQRIWDEAGAVGCRRFSWEFTTTKTSDHGHIIAVGCSHLAEFAAGQLAEIRRGGDGMAGTRGWAGPTPSFTPWRTRYAAFKAQLEEDMPLTDADILKLLTTKINASGTTVGVALEAAARAASLPTATDTTDALLGRLLGSSGPTVAVALQDTFYSVRALKGAAGVEVDVDETAMAQQVAAIVAPVVRDAVVAAVTAGGTPEAVADAVVAKLGAALQD